MPTKAILHITSIEGNKVKAKIVRASGHYLMEDTEPHVEEEEIFLSTKVGYIKPDDRHIIPNFYPEPRKFSALLKGRGEPEHCFEMPELKVGDVVFAPACSVFPIVSDRAIVNAMNHGRSTSGRMFSGNEMILRPANHVSVLGNTDDPMRAIDIAIDALKKPESNRLELRELDFAHAQHLAAGNFSLMQKDEALVMAWCGSDGNIETDILAAKGSFFFISEECALRDCGCPEPEEAGLFLFTNLEIYENRDWETGLVDDWGAEGDFKKLDLAAAANLYGSTEEELFKVIEEKYPYLYEGDVMTAMTKEEGGLSDEKALAMQQKMGIA